MKNEIGRKILGLTLMTIMLAGSMTIAFQGSVPDAYAINANLLVSAENTGSFVYGPQVIEILIIDWDLAFDALPDVTVNGDAVLMTAANDGNWYAYIADNDAVAAVSGTVEAQEENPGLNFGDNTCTGIANGDAADVYCGGATANAVKSAKTPTDADIADRWPFIQTYTFPSVIEIQYNKAGGGGSTQITTLDFDESAPGLSLDRSIYPPGATIHAMIHDHRLNIDPTSADVWTWNTASQQKYYGSAAVNNADKSIVPGTTVNAVCVACNVVIDAVIIQGPEQAGDVIEITSIPGRPLPDDAAGHGKAGPGLSPPAVIAGEGPAWFTIREINGPNTGIFSTTTADDNSILTVADDAPRGAAAAITYNDNTASIHIQYSTAAIDVQSPPDGTWMSGLPVPVVIIDGDANKNSRAADSFSVSDINSAVPTLVTGDPFTMGYLSDRIVTWTVHRVATPNAEYDRMLAVLNDPGSAEAGKFLYTHEQEGPIRLGGIEKLSDDAPWTEHPTEPRRIGIRYITHVDDHVQRGVVGLHENFDPLVAQSLTALGVKDIESVPTKVLVFDFEYVGADRMRDVLIDNRSGLQTGFNMINYNAESFQTDVAAFEIRVDGVPVTERVPLSGQSGYVNISDAQIQKLFGYSAETGDKADLPSGYTQLLLFFAKPVNIDTVKRPVIVDFFSFGYKNDGKTGDERVANQILRLELEESDSDTGLFEGTIKYVMINQLNINDLATYAGLSPVGSDASFAVIEGMTGSDAPSVTYLDVDAAGTLTPVSARQDVPSHTGVVSLSAESFQASDAVTVTLQDLDLNVDSGMPDLYTVVDVDEGTADANRDAVGSADVANGGTSVALADRSHLGRLLDITFDDQRWMTQTDGSHNHTACTNTLKENGKHTGLGDTGFSMAETGDATGIFVGTFVMPAEFCRDAESSPEPVTGLEIAVNYVDFRDQSGETIETGDSAGIKASTSSVLPDMPAAVPPGLFLSPDLRIVDTFGNSAGNTVSAGQQVQITADLTNSQGASQDFVYLVRIQDGNGVTVALSWISASMSGGQSLSPSVSWTPNVAGTYVVTAFVWESLENPTALLPPATTDVSVN